MELKPAFISTPNIKAMINVGACFDVATGVFVQGRFGEMILNGGLGNLTGVVGMGNNFKTTILRYFSLRALARMGILSTGNSYDTEINIHEDHVVHLMSRIPELEGENLLQTGRWIITDKTIYHGDEWFDKLKEYLVEKRKNATKLMRKTPFMNRDRTDNVSIVNPTFTEIDSMSEFVTQDVIQMQDDNMLGEKGANTMSMRQGLAKNRLLMELPSLAGATSNYTLMTAHIGDKFMMDPKNPPPKKLTYLKGDIKLKGVPEKFTFVMNNCYYAFSTEALINQGTKAPEFPRDMNDDMAGNTDLNVVKIRQLRSKSGPTGMVIEVVVSQVDGVLPSMTEFWNMKSNDRFGIGGNDRNYFVDLYPDLKLMRTTVRGKIDSDPLLRRAINISSEILQIKQFMYQYQDLVCTPAELYADLKAKGYDWEVLLNTRGWWTLCDNEEGQLPFLSSLDLLRMRAGLYHPYWLAEDKKTLIGEHSVEKAKKVLAKIAGKKEVVTQPEVSEHESA